MKNRYKKWFLEFGNQMDRCPGKQESQVVIRALTGVEPEDKYEAKRNLPKQEYLELLF
jgi:hypothetical protein